MTPEAHLYGLEETVGTLDLADLAIDARLPSRVPDFTDHQIAPSPGVEVEPDPVAFVLDSDGSKGTRVDRRPALVLDEQFSSRIALLISLSARSWSSTYRAPVDREDALPSKRPSEGPDKGVVSQDFFDGHGVDQRYGIAGVI